MNTETPDIIKLAEWHESFADKYKALPIDTRYSLTAQLLRELARLQSLYEAHGYVEFSDTEGGDVGLFVTPMEEQKCLAHGDTPLDALSFFNPAPTTQPAQ